MERVLPDIDADHGHRGLHCLKHGMLLGLMPSPAYSLTRQEHGRTIPLAEVVLQRSAILEGHKLVPSLLTAYRRICCCRRPQSDDMPFDDLLYGAVAPLEQIEELPVLIDHDPEIALRGELTAENYGDVLGERFP